MLHRSAELRHVMDGVTVENHEGDENADRCTR